MPRTRRCRAARRGRPLRAAGLPPLLVLRYGFAPTKVAFLACTAWHDRPGRVARRPRRAAQRSTRSPRSRSTSRTFCCRFFKTSQFKRSCVPNAPKVGSGGSLSPRGDWRAPSDSEATVWLADVERIPGTRIRRRRDHGSPPSGPFPPRARRGHPRGCRGGAARLYRHRPAHHRAVAGAPAGAGRAPLPVDRRLLDAIDLTLDSPRVGLQPEANRIGVEVALRAQGGGPIQTRLSGSLLISESLRFEPSDNTIRLVDVQVERFVIDGLPASWQRQLDRIGKPLARGLLEDQVLYTLRPKDVAGLKRGCGRATCASPPAVSRSRSCRRALNRVEPLRGANMPAFAMRRHVGSDAVGQGRADGHRRRPDRVPADLEHRAPDPRRLAARLHRRQEQGLRHRDPERRDRRGDHRLLAAPARDVRRTRQRRGRAALRAQRRDRLRSGGDARPAVRQGDQGAPVHAGRRRDDLHRRRLRHPLGRAAQRRRRASRPSTTCGRSTR